METAELGVAVANAVEALRTHADVVLERPDGESVIELLEGPHLSRNEHAHATRWQVRLGTDDGGLPVLLPASQLNVLVAGGAGEGKSYLGGLIGEQLIALGYSVLVIDPEGDHGGLSHLRGVIASGADGRLPAPDEVVGLIRHRYGSVVLDLSSLNGQAQAAYPCGIPAEIEAQRATSGLPQWVVIDEAHSSLGHGSHALDLFDPAAKGYCCITWRPEDLAAEAIAGIDAVIAPTSPQPSTALVDLTAAVADLPRATLAHLLAAPRGRAALAHRHHPGRAISFIPADRATPHLRHEHKYSQCGVDARRRFSFRGRANSLTGAVAANLIELQSELDRCDDDVLRHYCPGHDFSRWVEDVFHHHSLAAASARPKAP